jgi:hypothetical protein
MVWKKIRLRFCEVALITGWLTLAVRTFSSSTTVLILSRQGNQKSTYAEKTAQDGHRQQQKRFHCSVVDVGEKCDDVRLILRINTMRFRLVQTLLSSNSHMSNFVILCC